jgi:hypothetical protein
MRAEGLRSPPEFLRGPLPWPNDRLSPSFTATDLRCLGQDYIGRCSEQFGHVGAPAQRSSPPGVLHDARALAQDDPRSAFRRSRPVFRVER